MTSRKPAPRDNPAEVVANTRARVRNDGAPRLPHERDEASDDQQIGPRKRIKQGYDDLQKGLVDTDLHGMRGVEEAVTPAKKPPQ